MEVATVVAKTRLYSHWRRGECLHMLNRGGRKGNSYAEAGVRDRCLTAFRRYVRPTSSRWGFEYHLVSWRGSFDLTTTWSRPNPDRCRPGEDLVAPMRSACCLAPVRGCLPRSPHIPPGCRRDG